MSRFDLPQPARENEFETFIKDNFKEVPAVKDSRIREYMSETYGGMMNDAGACVIDNALAGLSRFSRQTRAMQTHILDAYIDGLMTNVEMMNSLTKFEEFANEAVPIYLTQILIEKCECVQP